MCGNIFLSAKSAGGAIIRGVLHLEEYGIYLAQKTVRGDRYDNLLV